LKNYNLHKKKRGGDGVELDPISLPFSLSEIKYKLILKLHLIVYIIKQNTIMSSLTTQLEQLKKQQEELEKRIQQEAETTKKLNNADSIERLEALVEPITEFLDTNRNMRVDIKVGGPTGYSSNKTTISSIRQKIKNEEREEEEEKEEEGLECIEDIEDEVDTVIILEREEIYVTLIGILKKQDDRIKKLETLIEQLS
tara:strand:- start:641 stop:1234 length:594 start_codon:yes stop_codon:yes gene_type:complete